MSHHNEGEQPQSRGTELGTDEPSHRFSRPLLIPDPFDGETNFDEWMSHFEDVAELNGWTDKEKLCWLKVRLIRKAHVSFNNLAHVVRQSYSSAKVALYNRFEPNTKRELYKVELNNRIKSDKESWADYGDSLLQLANKAYPDLQNEARELLALNRYMSQLYNPQITFAVRQRQPQSIQEAVISTIELESYLVKPIANCDQLERTAPQANVTMQTSMVEALQKLLSRIEQLETELERSHIPPEGLRKAKTIVCHTCGQEGHFAKGCAVKHKPISVAKQETKLTQNTHALPINNVFSYTLACEVYGTPVSFLIDTGAGVCLLKDEVWNRVKPNGSVLKPLKVHGLVGVDGVPIKVQGSATISLSIAGQKFNHDFVIANQITTDAIIGLDFLEAHKCILNMAEGSLSINGQGVALNSHQSPATTGCVKVTIANTVTIPASSEMEIAAHVNSSAKGVWLVEGDKSKPPPVCVARALVTTHDEIVPLVVNTNLTPVTLHKSSRIAIAEHISETAICNTTISDQVESENVHDIELADPLPSDITETERKQFLAFLSYYSDVVAVNTDELGRTNTTSH